MADPPPLPELRFTEIPATSRHRYVGDRFCSFVAGATQGSLWRGTDGSNPPPSSGESANFRFRETDDVKSIEIVDIEPALGEVAYFG